jgi:hypothetical protein
LSKYPEESTGAFEFIQLIVVVEAVQSLGKDREK